MKPDIYRICWNSDCESYKKEMVLSDGEKRSYISPYCPTCHRWGSLRVKYKGLEADSTEAFYATVGGMAREFHLLKKLVAKNVADDEDQKRYQEILEKIQDLECTDCGQKLIDHEH